MLNFINAKNISCSIAHKHFLLELSAGMWLAEKHMGKGPFFLPNEVSLTECFFANIPTPLPFRKSGSVGVGVEAEISCVYSVKKKTF